MTAPAAKQETQPRLVDRLPTIKPWLVAPQGTPGPWLVAPESTPMSGDEGLPVASEKPDELAVEETPTTGEVHGDSLAVDALLQDADEIVSAVEQEAPLAQFVQEVAEDQIAPEINEGVEAFVAKSEADGTTPEQEIHELVAQAAQNDTTPEINVVFVPQKRSEHEQAKAMSIKQGGSWLRRLVDKLAATLKLRGKVPAFQPEAAPKQA